MRLKNKWIKNIMHIFQVSSIKIKRRRKRNYILNLLYVCIDFKRQVKWTKKFNFKGKFYFPNLNHLLQFIIIQIFKYSNIINVLLLILSRRYYCTLSNDMIVVYSRIFKGIIFPLIIFRKKSRSIFCLIKKYRTEKYIKIYWNFTIIIENTQMEIFLLYKER